MSVLIFNSILFLGKIHEDGFHVLHGTLTGFTKNYSNNNHQLTVSNGRLPQANIPSQRFIKAIAIASTANSTSARYNCILGYWKLPDADVIPPKVLTGMRVGVGDGTTKTFDPPIAEWVKNTEEIFVNDVKLVRGVDYTCDNKYNAQGLVECSVIQDMELVSGVTTVGTNAITPVVGCGAVSGSVNRIANWNAAYPSITFAFPEDGVKSIKRFVMKGFKAYTSLGPGGSSHIGSWNGRTWTVEYSSDNETWNTAGTAVIASETAELILEQAVSARYWRFTVNVTKGNDTEERDSPEYGACTDEEEFYRITRPEYETGKVVEFSSEETMRFIEKIIVMEETFEVVFKAGVKIEIARES